MTHDAELLRADDRARSEALDVARSFIVQAPAGSGKTELLIQRYLRLLATVDDPEEVVAITFTRKAAAEMRLRVLDALRFARRGDEPEAAHEKVTFTAARAALRHDQLKDWRIVENPRRMRIQTLDSLNTSIARMQPITGSGAPASNPVPDEAELKRLYRRAAAATFDWLTDSGDVSAAVRELLMHVDNHTGSYIGYVARMLETRDQWLPFIGSGQVDAERAGELRASLEARLEATIGHHLGRCRDAFPQEVLTDLLPLSRFAAARLRDAGRDDHLIVVLENLSQMPHAHPDATAVWLGIVEMLLTKTGGWRRKVDKNTGFPPTEKARKAEMLDVLERLRNESTLLSLLADVRTLPPARYSDEQWSVLLALFHVLPVAAAELQRLFIAAGATDYIEIALSADHAIGRADAPGDVALLLDYQVRHILVDEMQDTSRAQYRMLEALTGGWQPGDGRTLFCVGDPMQSIYRFRNAEVAQFLLAQRNGIGNLEPDTLVLRRNFRSGEFLVHWFNTVFPEVFPDTDDPWLGAVPYTEAVPARQEESSCFVHPLIGPDTEAEAERGLAVVQNTLDENPGDDMAILVRSRSQLTTLLSKLRRAGMPYQAVEIDRLTDLPEIVDVLALTRAMVHEGDRLAWLALLRSPWIGLDWCDLHALVRNDAVSTIRELLESPERIAAMSQDGRERLGNVQPILDANRAVSRSGMLRDSVERTWLQMGGPALLEQAHEVDNVYRYLAVLEKIESAGTLHDVAELEAELDRERVSSTVDARLQVMTMHRAKGLQFDHVMLYGLGRIAGRRRKSVLSWLDLPDEHGAEAKIVSPIGPQADVERDPIHRYIEQTEAAKEARESARLLYVACTRARKSLHLVGHAKVASDGESIAGPDARSLLRLLWPAVNSQFEQALDDSGFTATSESSAAWLLPRLRRLEPTWQSPDVEPPPGQRIEDDVVSGEPVDYDWVGAGARIAGTIVHRWLQLIASGRLKVTADELRHWRPVTERWLRESGASLNASPDVVARVEAALRGVLEDKRGRWLVTGDGHAELALSGLIDGHVATGIIDRVRVDSDGTHWVVDYKTSSHEGGNLTGFLRAEADRYRDQMQRYASLYRAWSGANVRCALYFPLLKEFVEIDV